MKTKQAFVCGIFAVFFALAFAACGGGGGGNPPAQHTPTPQTQTYTGTVGEVTYELVITQNLSSSKSIARYTAKAGDRYVLTITPPGKKSTGTVSYVAGDVLTLQPSNSEEPFTATVSGNSMTALEGTITLTDNTTVEAPTEELTPVTPPETPGGGQPGGEQSGSLVYTLIDNGTAYSVSAGSPRPKGAVTIPASYNGKPVTEIGDFSWCQEVTSINIPSSVTYISEGAFAFCYNLGGNITIPAEQKSIGANTFDHVQGKDLTITFAPNSRLETIGDSAFGVTTLKSITIPSSVTSIGDYAFETCYYLESETSVLIPANVKSIGDYAFATCTSITGITIPASVTSIGINVFGTCTKLTGITVDAGNPNYSSQDGMLLNKAKTTLIQAPGRINGTLTIPASVTSISDDAFRQAVNLTSITIPGNVKSIGNYAFYRCSDLTSITILDGVTTIGESAFEYCKGLTGSINIPGSVTSIGESAFFMSSGLGQGKLNITLNEGLTSIGKNAFYQCALQSINIPSTVKSIGNEAFSSCYSISITIPSGVTAVGERAFDHWGASQTINVQGKTQAQADAAWKEYWRDGCKAVINYNVP